MRQAIGELMARSKREIPHYYLATTIDLSHAMAWLAEQNERRPVTERLLPAALLLKATALAAREVPNVNGFWDGGFQPAPSVHLGVAVSLRGGGLVAPAIHDADERSARRADGRAARPRGAGPGRSAARRRRWPTPPSRSPTSATRAPRRCSA